MHILYTIDKKYLDIMLASIYSMVEKGGLKSIHFHIVTSGFDEEEKDKLEKFFNILPNVKYTFYRLEDYPIDDYGIPSWRGTQIANARLFFPSIIKEQNPDIDNLLYIDSDTLIKNDLSGLDSYNDNTVCAVLSDGTRKKECIDRLGVDQYYNSGVIYFNLDKWKSVDFEHEIKQFNKQSIPLIYPDQDIFNLLLKDEIKTIPSRYNLSLYPLILSPLELKLYCRKKQIPAKELMNEKDLAVILHSIGLFNIKPWHRNNINPLTEDFKKYMEVINPDYQLEELSRLKKIISISPTLFKTIIIFRANLPKGLDDFARYLSLTLQGASERSLFQKVKKKKD